MKEQVLFVCDHCGTQYKDKNECKKCENSHKKPVEIVSRKYVSLKNLPNGYPLQIQVRFDDGSIRIYKQ